MIRFTSIIFYLSISILGFGCLGSKKVVQIQSPEEAFIRQTIEMYFDGWMTGDTSKLGKAMHLTCKLKNVKEMEVVVYDNQKYLSFFKPRPKVDATCRILAIDITQDIAAAKCQIETSKRLFTDYFNLMKVNGEWLIVDKIATNVAKYPVN